MLSENGRASWADMASTLRLSAPAVAERVKKLEQRGVIRGYAAVVDPERVGAEITAFVAVRLERPRHRAAFLERVKKSQFVLECHHVAGDDDYLLKVRVGRLRDLEEVVSGQLKSIDGVSGTRTTIVMSTLKETLAPPLSLPPE
jgi:Lrp/AsnC family leucine-responsive transcriptional regulator